MLIEELIGHLKQYPGDMQVWLARDEEGNGFSLLYQVEEAGEDYYDDRLDVEIEGVVLWP